MKTKRQPVARSSGHGQQVLSLLRRQPQPLTAYAILDKLRVDGIKAPTTVYRALATLTKKGLVHRIESLNAYIACQTLDCDDGHSHGVQFAICTACGMVQELPHLPSGFEKSGKKFLAAVTRQVVELCGICKTCAGRQKP
ncbi:MAG: transcriptional repressor [Alphaproteobacteria bacterium]|nr:transcriptional repressor [Alphaproteobacteria bacterium]